MHKNKQCLKSKSPVIGIVLDYEENNSAYSTYPWYALRANYSNAIAINSGLPILIPYQHNHINEYVSLLDGLIVAGGNFDIPSNYYNQTPNIYNTINKPTRTSFELAILKAFINTNKPILGICGGMQLINVLLGGDLIQHIPENNNYINHQQDIASHLPYHSIKILPNSKLYKIVKTDNYIVNSTHHQGVKNLGKGLIASAIAPDSLIEAIELTEHHFCLGLQWHPEYLISIEDNLIIKNFVEKCNIANSL